MFQTLLAVGGILGWVAVSEGCVCFVNKAREKQRLGRAYPSRRRTQTNALLLEHKPGGAGRAVIPTRGTVKSCKQHPSDGHFQDHYGSRQAWLSKDIGQIANIQPV